VDQNISSQQHMGGRAPSNRLRDMLPLISAALSALNTIVPGQVLRVP